LLFFVRYYLLLAWLCAAAGRPRPAFLFLFAQLVFSFSLPLAALGGSGGQCIQPLPLQRQQRWLKAAVDCAAACLPLRFNTCLFCQPERAAAAAAEPAVLEFSFSAPFRATKVKTQHARGLMNFRLMRRMPFSAAKTSTRCILIVYNSEP
jgi:hypothetical protein